MELNIQYFHNSLGHSPLIVTNLLNQFSIKKTNHIVFDKKHFKCRLIITIKRI
jgi:hypothetical protein